MEHLSELDAAFLAGETPTQHLHVLASLVLDSSGVPGPARYRLFQSQVAERFHLVEPLRRRLQNLPVGRPVWVDDPDVHLERHMHHVILDGGGLEAVAQQAGEIASHPLPRDRPLWEAWFIEGFDPEKSAVIAKIHHCAVDGVSGFSSLAAFFDLEPNGEPATVVPWDPPARPGLYDLGRAALDDVLHAPAAIGRSLKRGASSAVTLARAHSADTPLPFTGPRLSYNRALSPQRSVAMTTVRLDDIKELHRQFDVTINDVIIALCAGVLRHYAISHTELPERPLVAGVPVSERQPEHGLAGNRISMMLYGLPVQIADPIDRLKAVQHSATEAKRVYQHGGVGMLEAMAALAPPRVLRPAMRGLSGLRAANAMPPLLNVLIANIRGPSETVYAVGGKVAAMYPMGPLLEGVGLGITVLSYRDELAMGFLACPDTLPDVDELAAGVKVEVAALTTAAESLS